MPRKSPGPTRKQCMDAFCHQCRHFWAAGRSDCQRNICPLYPWMPYGQVQRDHRAGQTPDILFPWDKLNPKGVGYQAVKGVDTEVFLDAVKQIDPWVFPDRQRPVVIEESYQKLFPSDQPLSNIQRTTMTPTDSPELQQLTAEWNQDSHPEESWESGPQPVVITHEELGPPIEEWLVPDKPKDDPGW